MKTIKNKDSGTKTRTKQKASKDLMELTEDEKMQALLTKVTDGKYLRLRQTNLIEDIAEMILMGCPDSQVTQYIYDNQPEKFQYVKKDSVRMQVKRFREDLMAEVSTLDGELNVAKAPITRVDYQLLRFKGRPLIALGVMEKAIMVQENRVERAIAHEDSLKNHIINSDTGYEVERWFKMAKELATFKEAAGIKDDGHSAFAEMTSNMERIGDFYDSLTPEDRSKFVMELKMLQERKQKAKEKYHASKKDEES